MALERAVACVVNVSCSVSAGAKPSPSTYHACPVLDFISGRNWLGMPKTGLEQGGRLHTTAFTVAEEAPSCSLEAGVGICTINT